MPRQLTGRVVQVGTPALGPVLRSWQVTMIWGIVMLIFLPIVALAAVLVRFSISLIGSFLGSSKPSAERGFLSEYLNDTLAHLTAARLGKVGRTLITLARVRDSAGLTLPIRFEGHPVSGAVSAGDDVTVQLRAVRGIYRPRCPESRRTWQASICPGAATGRLTRPTAYSAAFRNVTTKLERHAVVALTPHEPSHRSRARPSRASTHCGMFRRLLSSHLPVRPDP